MALGLAAPAGAATFDVSYGFDAFASVEGVMEGTVASGILTVDEVAATITSTGGVLGVTSLSFDTASGGVLISGNDR